MRVDIDKFRKTECEKCNKYIHKGEKLEFGKCVGDFNSVYTCAGRLIFAKFEGREDK